MTDWKTGNNNWIQTFTGRRIFPLAPRAEDIDIVDIAHALSNVCRFTGHTKFFYSVGLHSIIVSHMVPEEDALWGLLHDASEAYLSDIARPVKQHPAFQFYIEAEDVLMRAVMSKFGLPDEMPASVKEADDRVLMTEKRDLLADLKWSLKPRESMIKPYEFEIELRYPDVVKTRFLERFEELTS